MIKCIRAISCGLITSILSILVTPLASETMSLYRIALIDQSTADQQFPKVVFPNRKLKYPSIANQTLSFLSVGEGEDFDTNAAYNYNNERNDKDLLSHPRVDSFNGGCKHSGRSRKRNTDCKNY